MQTRWRKLGRMYEPRPVHVQLATHASNPLPVHLGGDLFRVFFSGRDGERRSSVGYVDLDLAALKIERVCEAPVFAYGEPGSFFSHGVSVANCYEVDGQRYMLFMGWHIPEGGHWYGQIGRFAMDDELRLELDPAGPFMALDAIDSVSLSYPWAMRTASGAWRMFYGSTETWDAGNGEMLHVIRQAGSPNGRTWDKEGTSVPHDLGRAQAFSRPTVLESPRGFEMWFSYRGAQDRYRIGKAVSADAREWRLELDDAGIGVSDHGWDSEMVEYPFVFRHRGETFMLYCGNGYGLTGFGLAVLE